MSALHHPLLEGSPLASPCGLADSLTNCADVLYMLADLVGHDQEQGEYVVLSSPKARHGFWLQLMGVAEVIEAASQIATVEQKAAIFEEITIPFTDVEYQRVKAAADRTGRSVDDFVETLIREWADRFREERVP